MSLFSIEDVEYDGIGKNGDKVIHFYLNADSNEAAGKGVLLIKSTEIDQMSVREFIDKVLSFSG